MPATRLTYATKEFGGKPKTVHTKQWWFDDANEVKDAIANHADLFDGVLVVGNAFKADSFVKTGGTANDILLGDGTTSLLSNLQDAWDNVDGTPATQSSTDINYNGGNVGIGLPVSTAPTAKLDVRATVGGGSIFKFTTFGGVTTLQGNDTGSVWNSGLSGVVSNTSFGSNSGNSVGYIFNSFYGDRCGQLNNQSFSTGIGTGALRANTGRNPCAVGASALELNSGLDCNGVGTGALNFNTGNFTNGIGTGAFKFNTGDSCSGVGDQVLIYNAGDNNSGLGRLAGGTNVASNILLGGNNTFLGASTSYGTNVNISNATGVGANITLSQSNTVILGNGADVGIGTTNPDASSIFHVVSTTKGTIPFTLMTQAQRTAIATPAIGLHVYQTDGTEGVYVNKSTGWVLAY